MSTLADLAAEALGDTDGEEDIEKQIQQALNCPCIGSSHSAAVHTASSSTEQYTPATLFVQAI